MYQVIIVIHVMVAIALIGLVLIQHGKGADIGAGFGSGASNTVFGSQGTGKFLFKTTGGLALTFFLTSVMLSSLLAHEYQHEKLPKVSVDRQKSANDIPRPLDSDIDTGVSPLPTEKE